MANEFIIKNGFISNGNGVVQGDLNVTGNTTFGSLSATTISATTYQNLPVDPNTYTTGFTYSANTFTISDTSGNTYNATINSVTGLTVNGSLSATTISATTYQNLPISSSRFVTGFTYSPNTFTITDNSGNTYNATINSVTGLTVNGNLTITGNTTSDSFSGNTFSGGTFIGDGSQLNLGQPTVAARLYLYNNYY